MIFCIFFSKKKIFFCVQKMCFPCRGRPKKKIFFACNYFLNFTVKNFTAILYTILNPTSGIKDLKNTFLVRIFVRDLNCALINKIKNECNNKGKYLQLLLAAGEAFEHSDNCILVAVVEDLTTEVLLETGLLVVVLAANLLLNVVDLLLQFAELALCGRHVGGLLWRLFMLCRG